MLKLSSKWTSLMIVDEDAVYSSLINDVLVELGFRRVSRYSTCESAQENLEKEGQSAMPSRVILLSAIDPNAFSFLVSIMANEVLSNTRVVVIVEQEDFSILPQFFSHGAIAYLTKVSDHKETRRAVTKLFS